MISEFWPENIMISDFWAKKLTNSEMTRFNGKLFHFVFTVKHY